jgi:hypothetical protein
LLTVVDPVTEVAEALHWTCSESPQTGKGPNPPGAVHGGLNPVSQVTVMGVGNSEMSDELVTVPPAGVPWVLTEIGPEGGALAASSGQIPPKTVDGPY